MESWVCKNGYNSSIEKILLIYSTPEGLVSIKFPLFSSFFKNSIMSFILSKYLPTKSAPYFEIKNDTYGTAFIYSSLPSIYIISLTHFHFSGLLPKIEIKFKPI